MKRRFRYPLLPFIGLFGFSAFARADSGILEINVIDLSSSGGSLRCALYDSAATFIKTEYRTASTPVHHSQTTCLFPDLEFGNYAVAVLYDRNDNGTMDFNFLGMPKEPFGFSNNPIVLLSAPSFGQTRFTHDKAVTRILVRVK